MIAEAKSYLLGEEQCLLLAECTNNPARQQEFLRLASLWRILESDAEEFQAFRQHLNQLLNK